MQLISKQRILPSHLRFAAVGKGSADALKHYGINEVLVPVEHFDSEALLQQEQLKNIVFPHLIIDGGDHLKPDPVHVDPQPACWGDRRENRDGVVGNSIRCSGMGIVQCTLVHAGTLHESFKTRRKSRFGNAKFC